MSGHESDGSDEAFVEDFRKDQQKSKITARPVEEIIAGAVGVSTNYSILQSTKSNDIVVEQINSNQKNQQSQQAMQIVDKQFKEQLFTSPAALIQSKIRDVSSENMSPKGVVSEQVIRDCVGLVLSQGVMQHFKRYFE